MSNWSLSFLVTLQAGGIGSFLREANLVECRMVAHETAIDREFRVLTSNLTTQKAYEHLKKGWYCAIVSCPLDNMPKLIPTSIGEHFVREVPPWGKALWGRRVASWFNRRRTSPHPLHTVPICCRVGSGRASRGQYTCLPAASVVSDISGESLSFLKIEWIRQ